MSNRKSPIVAGFVVRSPRLTLHGALMIVLFAGLPIMTIGILLDILRVLLF